MEVHMYVSLLYKQAEVHKFVFINSYGEVDHMEGKSSEPEP